MAKITTALIGQTAYAIMKSLKGRVVAITPNGEKLSFAYNPVPLYRLVIDAVGRDPGKWSTDTGQGVVTRTDSLERTYDIPEAKIGQYLQLFAYDLSHNEDLTKYQLPEKPSFKLERAKRENHKGINGAYVVK